MENIVLKNVADLFRLAQMSYGLYQSAQDG